MSLMRGMANRNAWIWLTVAAITLATLSRTEAGLLNAKAFANPVLEFLTKGQSHSVAASPVAAHLFPRASSRRNHGFTVSSIGAWNSMLPVFFVGLLTPLVLLSVSFFQSFDLAHCEPLLSVSFQRPPPQIL
jgi:hypothetical protein